MPTYEYACTACGHRLEAVQKFSDPALTTCPECNGALRKVYGAVGIVLKGSGFYKTDSRASSNGSKSAKSSESGTSGDSAAKSDTPSSGSSTDAASKTDSVTKTESKPAASTTAS